jgi:H+-transporting ATPase
VVSHLPAVEEMAGVDVLCADKTGTITKNQLAVAEVTVLDPDLTRDEVLRDADLTAEPDTDDPIDQAIRAATDDQEVQGWTQTGLEPFDPIRKRAQATVQGPHGERRRVVKGAVQAVLDLVGPNDAVSERLEQATTDLAAKGHRALAVARQDGGGSWQVTGVLALADPPRDDSAETLSQAVRLGVDIKIVTGDREEIAREIAKQIGLGDQVLPASRIQNAEITQVADAVERADGFAEVVPEDKYRIVRALQEHEHIVAMTGDGVNDAAALRRADAGIAVSGATDAARAASDIVLLAPGLSTIVDAIYRSREVFGRMKNYAIYRITETIRVVCFVTLTIVVLGFFPVTPVQVVLLAILNDAAILSIAYDRVRPSSRPERWDLSEVIIIAAVLGIVGMLSTFALVLISQDAVGLDEATLRTLVYLKLSVSGHLTVFLARTRGPFWSTRPAGILVLAVVGTQVLATIIALTGFLMAPIGWGLVALAWGWAVLEFLLLDPIKLLTYGALRRQGRAAPSPQRDPTRTGSAARVTGGRATANGSAAARTHGRSARR